MKNKNLWSLSADQREVAMEKLDKVAFLANRMKNGIYLKSILVDMDYDEMMNLVAELYVDMDLESLALDNKRRDEEVKRKVKAAEKNK